MRSPGRPCSFLGQNIFRGTTLIPPFPGPALRPTSTLVYVCKEDPGAFGEYFGNLFVLPFLFESWFST